MRGIQRRRTEVVVAIVRIVDVGVVAAEALRRVHRPGEGVGGLQGQVLRDLRMEAGLQAVVVSVLGVFAHMDGAEAAIRHYAVDVHIMVDDDRAAGTARAG